MDWDLSLELDEHSPEPLYVRIADAIARDIRRGRLRAGTTMPGTRRLASTLGVHRNTTVAAYRELSSEGWIDTRPGRGTFVADTTPSSSPKRTTESTVPRPRPGLAATSDGDSGLGARVLSLSHMPDPRLAPHVALARAYRRALRRNATAVLDYANRSGTGVTFGHPRLRDAVAAMLTRTRGLAVAANNVLCTSGSQMALYLAALALVEPGDVIAVESLGYRPAWESFRLAGATLVPVPVDEDGMRVDALCELTRRARVRAVYVTPSHQHPTGVPLAPSRRAALLQLAATQELAIIEDDYDSDFQFSGDAVLPLASSDRDAVVIYVGSLSKVLAPGLRVGFAVAPAAVLERMAARRCLIDRQGDHAIDCAVAELLEDGDVRRHVHRVRGIYRARRDALATALVRELGDAVAFRVPDRGTAIWASVRGDIDVDAWHAAARVRGVTFCPGRELSFADARSTHARFGFAGLAEEELREAAARLRAALMDVAARSRT